MSAFIDLLFPPLCVCCRSQRRQQLGLCPDCLARVELTGLSACIRCGRHCPPGKCAPLGHGYSRVLSLAAYQGPWRQVVQNVKFGRDRAVARELARELAALAKASGFPLPRAVVPVPGAGKNWRNFDIIAMMCKELAVTAGAPIQKVLLRRPGRPPQVELNYKGRLEGLEDYIYTAEGTMLEGTVWLVDDVYTTGATADACARALLVTGAGRVYLFVLAA
ncbi:MAG: ComF family protein [Bacillota bacterium]|jgi:ComF family protein|nr:ComF family protein [Bacillota bacterium]HOC06831.1 double zinc ribbon domain-containing protein [Bacillota bacterium]HPZ22347.1 double zinc ribbon domain-containing protein [Bacillota bacterium]HQD20243.1 double zinc ribbon domain-containing protein [Bacillota bacterium]